MAALINILVKAPSWDQWEVILESLIEFPEYDYITVCISGKGM